MFVVATLNAAGYEPVGQQFGRFATEIGVFDITVAYLCLVVVVVGSVRKGRRRGWR